VAKVRDIKHGHHKEGSNLVRPFRLGKLEV